MTVVNGGMTLYTSNDSQETWSASDGLDTEVYKQGTGSESWLVGKNSSETSTMSKTQNFGASAKYFTFYMKSDWGSFYQFINATLNDGTVANLFEAATGGKNTTLVNPNPEISGDFKPSILQMDQGSQPTYDPTSHISITLNVNASTSGNIRAITNHWIDCMYAGTGRTITGSTVSDSLFTESNDLNISSDTFDGCSETTKAGLAYNTDIVLNTTLGNSYGETVTFAFNKNTDNIYTLEVTGTAAFSVSSYRAGSTAVTLNLDTSAATSWSMSGGSLSGAGTTVFKAGQSITGAVFSDRTSLTHSASTFEGNTVATSGTMTIAATGTCTANIFSKSTGTSAIVVANLSHAPINTFVSSGTGYAVDLGTIAATATMTWNSIDTGYAATNGTTGNETILVSVASAQILTINVGAGYTTPTIHNTGAGTVNVVSGQVTLGITVKDIDDATLLEGARVYVVAAAGGSLTAGTVIIDKVLTDNNGYVEDIRSYATNQPITGVVRFSSTPNFYKTAPVSGTVNSASGAELTIQMIKDI